ncbi:hypothetical protein HDU91_003082, partial [Kappamyces sp. JEL0680]
TAPQRKRTKGTRSLAAKKPKVDKTASMVSRLCRWWADAISWTNHQQSYSLSRALEQPDVMQGLSRETACLYFCALLRALGFNTRLIASLLVPPLSLAKSTSRATDDIDASGLVPSSRKTKEPAFPIVYSCQVWDPASASWIKADPLTGSVGDDVVLKDATYVIALESARLAPDCCIIKDVTLHYTDEWTKTEKRRCNQWWKQTLWLYSSSFPPTREQAREDALLAEKQVNDKMPSTIAGFLNHPLFVLERHLKVNELIYPMDKNEAI